MRIKRGLTAAGLAGAVTAAVLTIGVAPASANPTAVDNDRYTCQSTSGAWTDLGGGTGLPYRYTCYYRYPSSWLVFYYLESGELTKLLAGQLPNGGDPGNIHLP